MRAPLLFWLIDMLRPRHIAVVGDAARPAFLAACQAVGRLDLPTRVLGAFATPPPDELEGPGQSQGWRRIGAQHCLGTEAAQALLARDPVDLLVLDASAANLEGARAPELWRATLTGPRIIIVEARTADGPCWSTTLAQAACLRIGGPSGAHLAILDGSEEPAITALRSLLREPEKASQLQHCLERLGAGLAAGQAASEGWATAERLEITLSETAARGDAATTDLIAALKQIARLEGGLRAAEANAVTAQQRAAQLKGGLQAAEANAVTAQQRAAQLEGNLRAVQTNAVATQRDLARLEGNLQGAAADREAARKRFEKLELELKAALAHVKQVNQTLGDRLVVAEDRAAAAEAWRAAILASSNWRLSQRISFLFGDKPGGLKRLLRRSPKLLLWTVTLQIPTRWRLWHGTSAEVALPFVLVPPKGAIAGPDTTKEGTPNTALDNPPDTMLPSALQRVEVLENRASTLESVLEMERGRIDWALGSVDTTLASARQRVEVLEKRAATLESVLEMERGRIDWALGSVEGVTAQIDAYHAYRETEQYRAAYASTAPLVSVCVATVDRANLLLERSIASIRAQSYRNLQIIVVGDNCSDDTALRLATLADNRIQFVNLPERGPYPRPGIDRWYVAGSKAMNHALSLCEGQFVTHLDDDDAMVPHRIETLIAEALQYQADFLWHPFLYEHRDGTWVRLGNGQFELAQVSTGSIFYHRYFAQYPWDVRAYRLREPGDWNRLRKIKLLRPRMRFVDEPLLYHHAEQSQSAFIARDGERFLE
jgi:Glycosyl transferase family 2